MSATRKAIRHAIAAVLKDNTDAGANVFASRVRPYWSTELPFIAVYTRDEDAQEFNASPRELRRVVSVAIEIGAVVDDTLDDVLDDIADQVERIMSENQTLEEVASDVLLTRTDIAVTGEGKSQAGGCVLTYQVTYYTMDVSEGVEGPGVPDANVLQPFKRAGTQWLPNEATPESPETKDLTQLPQ